MSIAEFIALIFSLALGFGGTAWLTMRFHWLRLNFRQERIPAIAGLAFVIAGESFYAFEWLRPNCQDASVPAAFFIVTLGFGLLGLLDDLAGDRRVGGFRGHFGALARGEITTGALKAVGGGGVALCAGFLVSDDPIFWHHPGLWWRWPLSAIVIALTANTLNLFDLRPGRCLAAFFVGTLAVFAVLWHQQALSVGYLLWFAAAVAFILYPMDAGGRLMLGDAGANSFGAVLGLAFVLYFSAPWQILIVVLLIVFQFWSERYSLTNTIDRSPLLRRIDRKIGIR